MTLVIQPDPTSREELPTLDPKDLHPTATEPLGADRRRFRADASYDVSAWTEPWGGVWCRDFTRVIINMDLTEWRHPGWTLDGPCKVPVT